MTVAELGSGWGAFAIYIAVTTGARVTAINVSPEQLRIARENAVAAGVGNLVEFRELDYRALEGHFDRVVSVGMMEHVGLAQFDAYFGKIRSLLADDGFAFVHCIGRMRPPGSTGPFIRKYIFPGAYVPSLSEVFAATERAGLWVADMEVLRLHYHYTLQHWRRRGSPFMSRLVIASTRRARRLASRHRASSGDESQPGRRARTKGSDAYLFGTAERRTCSNTDEH
jgi:cyclopropane-fatty-acyl-phospholipid synthase